MTRYFNMISCYGVETVDEISLDDFKTLKEFWAEKKRLTIEYRIAGMNVYVSQRSTKEWREK